MRIGCCLPRERLTLARDIGFDFAELAVVESLLPLEGDATWRPIAAEIESARLPVEVTNVFFPGTWRLTGPAADMDTTRRYGEVAIRRAATLGVTVMVLGSGAARSSPEGWPQERALEQLRQVLTIMGDVGARYGVAIALEPLRRQESNIINTVADAVALAAPLQHPHVGVLADLYHMVEEQEPLDNLLAADGLLWHVHLADTGRKAPGTGAYDYPGVLARLKQMGYLGRLSIECSWDDWETESRAALGFLRQIARG